MDWRAKWYAERNYAELLQEDLKLRQAVAQKYSEEAVARVEIERQGDDVSMTIYSPHPGILIGRSGQHIEELRARLEKIASRRVRLSVREVDYPELEAFLVARSVARQIENRIAFRRAMKQAAFRASQAGAKGIKIKCAGRLAGAEIARTETLHQGQMPLHKLRAEIDYGFSEARTLMGRIGVKVWIYKGDILPEVTVSSREAKEKAEIVTAETGEVSESS
jgi:small subunit ribosomal protein S3